MHPHYERKRKEQLRLFAVRVLEHLRIPATLSNVGQLVEVIEVYYPASDCVACSNQLPDMLCAFHTAELSGHLANL